MKFLGNLLWIILGGWISAFSWIFTGIIWCCTIIGIPIGLQCFKLASISFNPFGKEVEYEGGVGSFIINVVWFIFSGIELAIINAFMGLLLCITIIGLPFGLQFFKIAKLSLAPFGARVVKVA